MPNDFEQQPKKNKVKILAIAIVIILFGVALYLMFVGFPSSGRDDDVSLNQINDERKEQTMVLYFWGDGCQPCTKQKPIIQDLERDYRDSNVTFYWFDASKHNDLTDHYDISGVPTTIVLNHNGIINKFVGYTDYDEIEDAIKDSIQ